LGCAQFANKLANRLRFRTLIEDSYSRRICILTSFETKLQNCRLQDLLIDRNGTQHLLPSFS